MTIKTLNDDAIAENDVPNTFTTNEYFNVPEKMVHLSQINVSKDLGQSLSFHHI
jgi:hypothetical protein